MSELETINQVLANCTSLYSDRIALQVFSAGELCSGLTYGKLLQKFQDGAQQIETTGAIAGDRIVLIAENLPEWAIAYLAILEVGATAVLLDPLLPAADLAQLIANSDPRLCILSPQVWEKLPQEATLGLPVLNLAANFTPFEGTPPRIPSHFPPTPDPDRAIACLIYTSGTGGFPKGVLVTHASLLHCARCGLELINFQPDRPPHRFLCILPLHHIAALTGLAIAPLLGGASVTFVESVDKDNILAALKAAKITILPAVPRFYELIYRGITNQIAQKGKVAENLIWGLGSVTAGVRSVSAGNPARVLLKSLHQAFGGELQYCFSGAAPLAMEVKEGMEKLGFTLLEGYGLTEAGVCVYNTLTEARIGHVGKPYREIELRIDLPDPTTGEGEICLRGVNLMKGYFRDPVATAEALRDGWLHTGDLGRLDDRGNLVITGRIKELIVTAGGKKASPNGIEEYYRGLTGVKELAVFGITETDSQGESVRAAIVLDPEVLSADLDADAAIQMVWEEIVTRSTQIPNYLRIQKIHLLAELPKTTTLKVKRKELQKMFGSTLVSGETAIASRLDLTLDKQTLLSLSSQEQVARLETYLLGIVGTVLNSNLSPAAMSESLLSLGIDSLNATELTHRIYRDLEWEVSIEQILSGANIRHIAASWGADKPDRFTQNLAPIPITRRENLPLSAAQERLWLLDRIAPDSAKPTLRERGAFNLSIAVQLTGLFQIDLLKGAIDTIVQRHEILRTNYPIVAGFPVPTISPTIDILWSTIDLQDLSPAEQLAEVNRLAALTSRQPFNLETEQLWRISLVQLTAESHILLLTIHHLIADVRSISIFFQELSIIYAAAATGTKAVLPDLPIQYVDFAAWQQQQLQGEMLDRGLAYWKQQLAGISGDSLLPIAIQSPAKMGDRGGRYNFKISTHLWAKIENISQQYNVTPFITLLAAFNILIYQTSGQTDIVVGSPILGRNTPDLQSLIGFFAQPLLLRNDLTGNPSFGQLLERVRQVVLDAYTYQYIPLERAIETVELEREKRNNILRILFSFVGKQPSQLSSSHLTITPMWESIYTPTDLDLLLTLLETDKEAIGILTYNPSFFTEESITKLINSYLTILEKCMSSPDLTLDRFNLPNLSNHQIERELEPEEKSCPQIIIAANFTADPILQPLHFWARELDLNWQIELAPYDNLFQQLLDPDSLVARNRSGINIWLLRLEDWVKEGDRALSQQTVTEFITAIKAFVARTAATPILCLCPANPDAIAPELPQLEETIAKELAQVSGLSILTTAEIDRHYPVSQFYDRDADELGHIPYTPQFFTALGTAIARQIYHLDRHPYKVIVLDCDRTLWSGVCGEDSIDNIIISPPYLALQQWAIELQQSGMLLCLCSKNHEADVFGVYDRHPDMQLRTEHLAAWRINWQPKSENLKSLAQELQLGLDSFVFIDDNPVECAEVRTNCPEVLTLQLPEDTQQISNFLAHIWAVDRGQITDADRTRTLQYQQNIHRQQALENAPTLTDFIQGLNLQIDIQPLSADRVTRVAQLTQRTNQFNNRTIRRSVSEIENLCQTDRYKCLVVEVKDRFGDYGLVGVIFYLQTADRIKVDTLLLSCRVLGRGVEHQMLAHLGRIGQEQGLAKITIPYLPTDRNQPILDFLTAIGEAYQQPWQNGYSFELPVNYCAAITYSPPEIEERDLTPLPPVTRSSISANSKAIQNIATNLNEVEKIEREIEGNRDPSPLEIMISDTPTAELTTSIATAMAQVLGVPEISPTTDFLTAGATSLDAVRLLSNLRHQFDLKLTLDDLFLHPTPASLSNLISNNSPPAERSHHPLAMSFARDLELDLNAVPFQTQLWQPRSELAKIFLTGATGFLGAFLLMDLLRLTDATIYCLIRADDPETGLKRLQATFERYDILWSNEVKRRICIVPGDLSQPKFGWSEAEWLRYATEFDAIYHCGADVHFTRPYESLRSATVEGTRTILALASQTRLKPVQYVSSMGVLHSEECLQREYITEADPLGNGMLLPTGYQQAKWVAEGLVTRARERGIPVVIFRPGIIGPHSRTGVLSSKDLSVIMLRAVFKHNLMPHSRALDMAPVDWVSRALVTISLQVDAIGQTFHLVHPHPIAVADLRQGSALAGFNLRLQALDRWLEEVYNAATQDPDHPMAPLTPVLAVEGTRNLVRILTLAPPVSIDNTLKALAGTYVTCPPIDRKQLEIWFDRFQAEGVVTKLAPDYRYLWFKERFRGFCSPQTAIVGAEDKFAAGYQQGIERESPLDLDISAAISSIAQVLDDRRISVEGTVSCPLIHPTPLKISAGYWQLLAHEAIHLQTDSESRWLRYELELTDDRGNPYWLEGEKIIRLGWDIWRQTRTLNVSIRDRSGQTWVGQTIIPSDTYLDDQVRGLRVDENVPPSDRQRAKLIWLLILWGSGGRTYLQLLLRFGSSWVYEYIKKR